MLERLGHPAALRVASRRGSTTREQLPGLRAALVPDVEAPSRRAPPSTGSHRHAATTSASPRTSAASTRQPPASRDLPRADPADEQRPLHPHDQRGTGTRRGRCAPVPRRACRASIRATMAGSASRAPRAATIRPRSRGRASAPAREPSGGRGHGHRRGTASRGSALPRRHRGGDPVGGVAQMHGGARLRKAGAERQVRTAVRTRPASSASKAWNSTTRKTRSIIPS